MMIVLAIDPGPVRSACLTWNGSHILTHGIFLNDDLRAKLPHTHSGDHLAIEMVASFGMAVGAEVFETVFWIGRFVEAWGGKDFSRITRMDVKMHICHNSRAKDANIRAALIDRLGAPGTKKAPGVTYGISKDLWSALAVAVTWHDQETARRSQLLPL